MKKNICLTIAAGCVACTLSAQEFQPQLQAPTYLFELPAPTVGPSKTTVRIGTDKREAVYAKGEPVKFRIELSENGRPVTGKTFFYILRAEGQKDVSQSFEAKGEPQTVEAVLDTPGWIWLTVHPVGADGKPDMDYRQAVSAGAMVAPQEIRQALPEPSDFDAFWRSRRQMLDPVVKATVTPAEVPDNLKGRFECFDVKVDCAGSMPVSGYLTRPINAANGTLNAMVQYQAAGVRSADRVFRPGTIVFSTNAHGIPNGETAAFYDNLRLNELKNYQLRHADDREKFYFHDMFLRAIRAVDFIMTRPEWNGKELIAYGSSQGGAQAIAAAALQPRVTMCVATVPAMCDHGGVLMGRNSGWPRLFRVKDGQPDHPKVAEVSGYYDSANFARRLRCPSYFSAGFADTTTSPSSIYAAFNNLDSGIAKAISIVPTGGHNSTGNVFGNKKLNEALQAR